MIRIGYARTSKDDLITANQVLLLQDAGCERVYKDEGISGVVPPKDRREFKEMIRFIDEHQGEKIEILIFDLSRLCRSMYDEVVTIKDLESRGCVVKSLSPTESFLDIEEPSIREIIRTIMAWAAERERQNLIARTKAGLERARREGKRLGRPPCRLDKKKIEGYRDRGLSWERIAREENVSTSTVLRFVKREERKSRGLT